MKAESILEGWTAHGFAYHQVVDWNPKHEPFDQIYQRLGQGPKRVLVRWRLNGTLPLRLTSGRFSSQFIRFLLVTNGHQVEIELDPNTHIECYGGALFECINEEVKRELVFLEEEE